MKKVVIIDDNIDILENLADFLSLKQFDVYSSANSIDAAKLIQNIMPNLVICDIVMPKKNGFEILEEVRMNVNTLHIPFIFLSSKDSPEDIRKGMKLGVDDYITKPFSYLDLYERIKLRIDKYEKIKNLFKGEHLENIEKMLTEYQNEFSKPLTQLINFSTYLKTTLDILSFHDIKAAVNNIYDNTIKIYEQAKKYELLIKMIKLKNVDKSRLLTLNTNTSKLIKDVISEYSIKADVKHKIEFDLFDIPIRLNSDLLSKLVLELFEFIYTNTSPNNKIYIKSLTYSGNYILQISDIPHDISSVIKAELISGKSNNFNNNLSLLIGQKIVELIGGNIAYRQVPDQLTEVSVLIPSSEI